MTCRITFLELPDYVLKYMLLFGDAAIVKMSHDELQKMLIVSQLSQSKYTL